MKQRLGTRITCVVALISLLVAGLASVISYRIAYSQTRTHSRQLLTKLAETVQSSASIAVYIDNREIADEVINGLIRHELVEAVYLSSKTGLNVISGARAEQFNRADAVTIQLESPFIAGTLVGRLILLPRQALIDSTARNNALIAAIVLVGFTFLVAAVVALITQHLFIRPLRQVSTALEQIVPGETVQVPTPEKHLNDEIGELTQYLSRLLCLVKQKLDTERTLRQEYQGLEQRFRMIFERAGVGMFLLDTNGSLLIANKSFKKLIDSALGLQIDSSAKNCLKLIFQDSAAVEQMLDDMAARSSSASADLMLKSVPGGEERWVHCLFTLELDDTGETILQGIINDITDRKKREQYATYHAEHDPLTQLLNRRSVEEKLKAALMAAEAKHYCVTVFMIDLDRFKPINDTYGHDVGDQVLVEVAARLTGCLRQADVVGRLGGDEFLAATIGNYSPDGAKTIAGKLLQALGEEFVINSSTSVTIGASIGIAHSSVHGTSMSELISKADRAMYQVKSGGRNGYLIFSE